MSPSFFGREEDSNPPGLGPGDTRGRTEAPDHFHGECSITSNARDCGSRLCGCNFRHSPQFQRDVAQEQSAGLGDRRPRLRHSPSRPFRWPWPHSRIGPLVSGGFREKSPLLADNFIAPLAQEQSDRSITDRRWRDTSTGYQFPSANAKPARAPCLSSRPYRMRDPTRTPICECGVTTARNPARVEVEVQLFSLAPNLPGMWRNEKTRKPQKLVEKSVEMQVLPCPPILKTRWCSQSTRLPLTQEIMGADPIRVATFNGA